LLDYLWRTESYHKSKRNDIFASYHCSLCGTIENVMHI